MELSKLFVSQRKLRAPEAIPALIAAVLHDEPLPPIVLSEDEDGSVQIEDGHHRATAFWLSGRTRLGPHEYLLFPRMRHRPRFGHIVDLIARVRAGGDQLEDPRATAAIHERVRGPPGATPRIRERRYPLTPIASRSMRTRPATEDPRHIDAVHQHRYRPSPLEARQ